MPISPCSVAVAHDKNKPASTLQGLLQDRGWEEAGVLGSGARGPVLLVRQQARDTGRIRYSALKQSVHAEVRALRALGQCRNVMKLEEYFTNPGINEVWVRLEWLEGGSLRGFLRGLRPSNCSEDAARFLLGEVLEGLQEIHRQGWMHRDIKAENIGLSKPDLGSDGRHDLSVKLLDFDTATPIPGSGGKLTEIIGTVENMAPEVYAASYDEKADLWSFGVVLFEVLFGYRPFNDPSIDQIEEMIKNWQRYLMIPSDASENAAGFLRGLLASPKDRLTASEALRHPWQRRSRDPMNVGLAAAALSDVLEKEKEAKSATAFNSRIGCLSSATSLAPPQSTDRRGSLPSCLPRKASSPAKAIRRATEFVRSGTFDGDNEVESLSRIRRSLSEWNAPSIGSVYGNQPFYGNTNPMSRSRIDAFPFGNEGRPAMRHTEVSYSEECLEPGSSTGSSASTSPEDQNEEGPAAGEDYSEYLRRVRARTQEVVRAATLAAATPQTPPPRRVSMDIPVKSQSLSARHGLADLRRASASSAESYEESETPITCESPLAHLKDAQQKMKDLLSRLSASSSGVEAANSRATASSAASPQASQAPSTPVSRLAPVTRSPDSIQPESEPTPTPKEFTETSASPEAWLAQQRRRTEKLLGRLRLASEGFERDFETGSSTPVWV